MEELPRPGFRKAIGSLDGLTRLGRVQLSRHFFMRNFLYSEIGAFHDIPNLPEDPNLAIDAGRRLAQHLLEPLVATFGPIAVRSAYRSPTVNAFGCKHGLGCSSNEANRAAHIWDARDAEDRMGASASVVIPWFARRYEKGRDWRDLAWWLYDHLDFHEVCFFPKQAAFNIGWREEPERSIRSWIGGTRVLVRPRQTPSLDRAARHALYADFPPFEGICYPD